MNCGISGGLPGDDIRLQNGKQRDRLARDGYVSAGGLGYDAWEESPVWLLVHCVVRLEL